MKKAHLVITQLQHENMELKKNVLEKTPKVDEIEPVMKTTQSTTNSKGKEKATTRNIQELETSSMRIFVTRSSSRKLQLQKESEMNKESMKESKKVELDEGKHTFHR